MMEFTYNGLVRYGFGFYNPNHAAALFCAIMPFLWGWKRHAWAGWILSLLLVVPLALTYSRTGLLILGFEFVAYFVLAKPKNWKLPFGIFLGMVAVAGICGMLSRFILDQAITNRPAIWLAGLKLCAANPFGVGLGNSGKIVSAFLLDGIECRTLVNSHLTLLAEFGVIAALVWIALIVYALLNGVHKRAVWCAFAGLTLSACSSSVFDWPLLFDFAEYGQLTLLNFLLSWANLLLFLVLGGILICGKPNRKKLALSAGIALIGCGLIFAFYSSDTPRLQGGFIVKSGKTTPLVLYSEEWSLKTVIPYLNDGYILPLNPGLFYYPGRQVYLFGNAVEYVEKFSGKEIIFISPPEF
ncbi:MAG: O-antigen ligase family protein [Victivallales bacterium]|jgi:hypothetical protein|nr:O-antigen ligase family protein [Victivallales bacterium]